MAGEFFLVHFFKRLLDGCGGDLRSSFFRRDQRSAEAVALWVSHSQALGIPMPTELGRGNDRDFGSGPRPATLVEPFLKEIRRHFADAPPFFGRAGLDPPVKIVRDIDGCLHRWQVNWFPVSSQSAWLLRDAATTFQRSRDPQMTRKFEELSGKKAPGGRKESRRARRSRPTGVG